MRRALPLLVLAAIGACDRYGDGIDAYDAGDYKEAHRIFREALEAGGDEGPAELFYNRALAALRDTDTTAAIAAADRAAARGDAEIEALCEFLRGNAWFHRCELAAKQADMPQAEPFAFDVAIMFGKRALSYWKRAAMTRNDWPEARRNVERALKKIEELERKKAEAEDRTKRERNPNPKQDPQPPPPRDDPKPEPDPKEPEKVTASELNPGEVMQLLERLVEKEREKRDLRRAERGKRAAGVEKDW